MVFMLSLNGPVRELERRSGRSQPINSPACRLCGDRDRGTFGLPAQNTARHIHTMASKLAPMFLRGGRRAFQSAVREQQKRTFQTTRIAQSASLNVVCMPPGNLHGCPRGRREAQETSDEDDAAPKHSREQPRYPLQVQQGQ